MPKRGVNIYKRKDGRWEGRIKKEDATNHSGKYISVYGKTYTEVKTKMEQIIISQRNHTLPCKCLMKDAAIVWLNEKGSYWKPTTYTTYAHIVEKYIMPKLGNISIDCINEEELTHFLADIRCNQDGNVLSARYLHNICAVVLKILTYGSKKYHYNIVLPENPINVGHNTSFILPAEKDMAVLEKYLLEHAGDSTCLGILIAFYTGMRIGEICALTWEDINLEEELIYIRKNIQRVKVNDGQTSNTQVLLQTPKTSNSVRIIPIPPVLLPLLKSYQKPDELYVIKGKKRPWAEPRTLQYRFSGILKKCGIENFNFHMLRHAFATRCVAEGFDVKSLSEILGHSNIQITLNLYVHSNMERKRQLMRKLSFCYYQDHCSVI
ncbi:MAG: tyrosine-type recombinase/integrase [Firmicutes bacterium]|nr:tyrosine-type recombinase/integrase [Bacillota bacterium]